MSIWQFQLLGEFRAVDPSGAVAKFRDRKCAELVAFLVLHPSGCDRERLGEALWPNEEPTLQRNRLRYALTMARKALGEDNFISSGNASLALPSSMKVDLFQRRATLATAVREASPVRRVEFLEGLLTEDFVPLLPGVFSEWADSIRRSWEREWVEAMVSLASAQIEIGRWDRARHWARRGSDLFPDRDEWDDLEARIDEASVPPVAAEGFFGRRDEFAVLRKWFRGQGGAERLWTLTGQGGIGKTRLAQEATAGLPIAFVALADLTDPERLWDTLRAALALPPTDSPKTDVTAHLASESGIRYILLDNLEQLGAGGAAFVGELLSECPGVRVLVTSQRRLDLPGERELILDPLSSRDGFDLFLSRARAERADFAASPEMLPVVREICILLDGVPLAIELAAARAGLLGPVQMRDQLGKALDFLRTRRPDLPVRHRSVRAALDWSVSLLSESARDTLGKLSIFRGGCSPEAALAVCGDTALDDLEELKARSLVRVEYQAGETARYVLLSLIREHIESLLETSIKEDFENLHSLFFCEVIACEIYTNIQEGEWKIANAKYKIESRNIDRVIRIIIDRKDIDRSQIIWNFLIYLFFESGYWYNIDLLWSLVGTFFRDNRQSDYSKALSILGGLERRRGNEAAAMQFWEERLSWEIGRDGEAVQDALIDLISQSLDIGDVNKSIFYLSKLKEIRNRNEHLDFHCELSQIRILFLEKDIDNFSRNADNFLKRLYLNDAISIRSKLFAFSSLGRSFRLSNLLELAHIALYSGGRLAFEQSQNFTLAWLLSELRDLYSERQDWDNAMRCAFVAREIHFQLNSRLRKSSEEEFLRLSSKTKMEESGAKWPDVLAHFFDSSQSANVLQTVYR